MKLTINKLNKALAQFQIQKKQMSKTIFASPDISKEIRETVYEPTGKSIDTLFKPKLFETPILPENTFVLSEIEMNYRQTKRKEQNHPYTSIFR